MSSRIVAGGVAARFPWKRVGEGADAGPGVGAETALSGGGEELLRELGALRREAALREERAREEGHRSGHAAGLREGETQGRHQAQAEYDQALAKASQSIGEMLASRRAMRRQMEEDLVHLAVAVARRILHRELHVDPEALVGIVKAAVTQVERRELHRLQVAPYDATFLRKHIAELHLPERVEVVADPALPRGSLLLQTARGSMDASVETQLQEIDRGFADLVRRS